MRPHRTCTERGAYDVSFRAREESRWFGYERTETRSLVPRDDTGHRRSRIHDQVQERQDIGSVAMISDWDLMPIHVSALYRHDERNRLLAVNEPGHPRPDDSAPPRLYIGRIREGLSWRFRHDLPEWLIAELEMMLAAEPVEVDLSQPPRCLPALQATLARDAPLAGTWSGPAWHFPDEILASEHEVVRVTTADDDLVRPVFPLLADDLPWCQPCLAIIADGRLASLCFSSRNTPIAAEAGVNTLEEFRGRGYAPAVVGAWGQAVRAEGRIPLYSTSWDNLASRSVAHKLGLVLYGADLSIE